MVGVCINISIELYLHGIRGIPAVPMTSVPATVVSLPPSEDASLPVPPSVSSVEDMVVSGPAPSNSPAVASSSSSQKNLSTAAVPSGGS